MSDEQQVIRDLAREFVTKRGDELWKMCCENYRWNSADVRKQNVVMIGLHLGFQAALATSVALAKIKEETDGVPSTPAETATEAN
jgi:hypothetical protein